MEIEFDPAKDRANRTKHGVSLALGAVILANAVHETAQWQGDEERMRAFGPVGTVLYVCVYTMRGPTHRIISVRRATRREQSGWR